MVERVVGVLAHSFDRLRTWNYNTAVIPNTSSGATTFIIFQTSSATRQTMVRTLTNTVFTIAPCTHPAVVPDTHVRALTFIVFKTVGGSSTERICGSLADPSGAPACRDCIGTNACIVALANMGALTLVVLPACGPTGQLAVKIGATAFFKLFCGWY
jgi:hypothetical protein